MERLNSDFLKWEIDSPRSGRVQLNRVALSPKIFLKKRKVMNKIYKLQAVFMLFATLSAGNMTVQASEASAVAKIIRSFDFRGKC